VRLDQLPNRLGVLTGISTALQRQGKHTASWMHQPAVERVAQVELKFISDDIHQCV